MDCEDVSVLGHHVVALHGIAGLHHHPVCGLAVGVGVQGPGEDAVGVNTFTTERPDPTCDQEDEAGGDVRQPET